MSPITKRRHLRKLESTAHSEAMAYNLVFAPESVPLYLRAMCQPERAQAHSAITALSPPEKRRRLKNVDEAFGFCASLCDEIRELRLDSLPPPVPDAFYREWEEMSAAVWGPTPDTLTKEQAFLWFYKNETRLRYRDLTAIEESPEWQALQKKCPFAIWHVVRLFLSTIEH
jgi:hypothetical protein